MPDDAKKAIMASRASVISIAVFGGLFAATGIYKTWYVGTWGYAAGLTTIVFAIVWSIIIYRLVRYPLVTFNSDTIEIVYYPLSRSKRIVLNDVKDVYSSWDNEARILLTNGKKIHLPVSMMKKADYEFILLKVRRDNVVKLRP